MGSGKRFRHRLVQSLLVTVMLLAACSLMAATNVKLSGAMPAFGDIAEFNDFRISPDGRYIVYRADQDTDQVFELYSVSLTGGVPIRLNPLLPVGRSVESFQISPDSSRVVYTADQETNDIIELYSVPIGGPAASGIKLNRVLAAGGNVYSFQISPDSSRVIYRADQETNDVIELYSVPLGGPATSGIKLNRVLAAGGNVYSFQISPDNSRVVYRADQQTNDVFELYSVPIVGPAEDGIKINKISLSSLWTVNQFQISPDSSRVIYRIEWVTSAIQELYSVPIEGPAASGIKLNGTLAEGGYVLSDFQISPDSGRVVYKAAQETAGVPELYSVPIEGPATSGIKLNGTLAEFGDIYEFKISPDSSRVVYRADQQTNNVTELYSVPLGGPAASGIKLNRVLAVGGHVVDFFNISPDSSRVVYEADQETLHVFDLFSVPLGGPAASGIKLNGTLAEGGHIYEFKISPDSSRVVYIAAQETAVFTELFGVPLGGPAASGFKLNGALTAGGDVMHHHWFFQISPDSSRVFYVADQDTDEVMELYMTSFDDTPDPFAFVDLIGVSLNTAITSNTITVRGINTGTPISISGGEYSINERAYTSSPGMVNNGDRITVRLTSSNSSSTTTGAMLTIGGISDTFNLTTMGLINLYLPLILN